MTDQDRCYLLAFQRNEITEHHVYRALARRATGRNREVLERIAADEYRHYRQFQALTGQEVAPNWVKVWFYRACAAVFGFTFGMRLMEQGEQQAEKAYAHFQEHWPEIAHIITEEARHEHDLINLVDEEHLRYMGSMVLALNNSIQEFSGIAAGLTFAMPASARTIGITVLISGLAATLAMSASEYLSQKAQGEGHAGGGQRNPIRSVLFSGSIYLFVVLTIVMPYFFCASSRTALAVAVGCVGVILSVFTFFMSVVKGLRYRTVLLEAIAVALVVVAASFLIGKAANHVFGVAAH
jgi:VIT1/CCC1 family predicted Fe2+/Mn2+ transporter